jgi:predicted 3-demethylubiquinone-9 3-methyltransferase (glyoxalase superfamily)
LKGITPFLWFDDQAEQAAKLYVSIFSSVGRDSEITDVARYGGAGAQASGRPEGSVMTVAFRLGGHDFVALNGGPEFHFTEAVSLMVNCENQGEVDHFWERLSAGGEQGPCGWLKDRYGLVVAGRTHGVDRDAAGQRPEARRAGDGGDAPDEED